MKFSLIFIIFVYFSDTSRCLTFHDYDQLENIKSVSIPGDYIIGALFPVHNSYDDDDFACGDINEYDGIQIMEAAFFAIDSINNDSTLLPNVTLGIDIKDYCNSLEIATLQAQKLVDKSVSRSNITEDIFSLSQKGIKSPLIGIMGPDSSAISVEVQSLLKFFAIAQIGYSEPLMDLVNDQMDLYEYFFSVIPGNLYLTDVVFDILMANNWTYVLVVHSSDPYGISGVQQFQKIASEKGVCIADTIDAYKIIRAAQSIMYDDYSDKLYFGKLYEKVNVIVCYCSPAIMNLLYNLIKNDPSGKRFVVIGGDGWTPRKSYDHRYEDAALGEIRVSLKQPYIQEFDQYFFSRNLQNNKRNPWFDEFWQNRFKCKIKPEINSKFKKCNGTEPLSDDYHQNPKVPHVIKSMYILAHALHNMLKEGCFDSHTGFLSIKDAFYKSCYREFLREVDFTFYGEHVAFDYSKKLNDVKYIINNFQLLEDGTYDYTPVGEYIIKGVLALHENDKEMNMYRNLVFPQNKSSVASSCGEPCPPAYAKVLRSDKCCWDCVLCNPLEILVDSTRCVTCKHGFMSNDEKTSCIPIPMEHIKWHDTEIFISLALSIFCISLTSFTLGIFIKYRETPVVKSSTKELCYIMFAGMIMANFTPFVILLIPNVGICIAFRLLPVISFTTIYAPLLVKTNRIARILAISKKKFPNLRPKFLSLKAQITMTMVLITVEISICLHSLYKYHAEPSFIYRQKQDTYYGMKICYLDEQMMLETYIFIAILLLVCTYYALKTRNLPENFNEAKCIAFAMYATILTDIACSLIYFGSDVKILTRNSCISINTLIILMFLFAPKLYIILWTPEKNNKAYFTTTINIRSFLGNQQR